MNELKIVMLKPRGARAFFPQHGAPRVIRARLDSPVAASRTTAVAASVGAPERASASAASLCRSSFVRRLAGSACFFAAAYWSACAGSALNTRPAARWWLTMPGGAAEFRMHQQL